MSKYKNKPIIVDAEPYKEGMEDGWRLYYSYENYDYSEEVDHQILFKSLKALEQRRMEMCSNMDLNNRIIFEEPVPVIKTPKGIKDVKSYETVMTYPAGSRDIMYTDEFNDEFELIEE